MLKSQFAGLLVKLSPIFAKAFMTITKNEEDMRLAASLRSKERLESAARKSMLFKREQSKFLHSSRNEVTKLSILVS